MLCAEGTVAGNVKVGGNNAVGELVQVIQNGKVVGSATTDANGNYIINGIATDCFSTACPKGGCDSFYVRTKGWQKGLYTWDGCGDIVSVNFAF